MQIGRRNCSLKHAINILVVFFLVTGILAFCSSLPFTASAASPEERDKRTVPASRKVVLILINGTALGDYSPGNTPNIYTLLERGGAALMNTRSGGSRNIPNAYATIGAGRHVVSSSFAGDAFNTNAELEDEISADISYLARTGLQPPSEGVVNLGISQIKIANEKEGITEGPGALGDALQQADLKTAVLGNGDVPDHFNRDAVTIAMDRWGRVDFGNVSRKVLQVVPRSPLSYYTNYEILLEEFDRLYQKADFLVVETGDTYRAQELGSTAFPEVMAAERNAALRRADDFVGRILETVDLDNTLILLTSPFPSEAALAENNYMTPMVLYSGEQKAGFLTSGSTRREGVVTNLDIAPTVLEYLGVPIPPGMIGRAMETMPGSGVVETLTQMNSDMVFVYKARPVLVKGYVGLQIIVMLVVIAIMVLWPRHMRYLRPLLLWLMAVPLSLLLVAAVRFVSLPVYTLIAILIAFLAVLATYKLWFHKDVDLFWILGVATAILILGDALTGSNLIKHSTLGYDPMSGSRYYGIGNEYMGVIIGAEIIAVASLWERFHSKYRQQMEWITLAFFGVTIFFMGAPQLGSNVGGTIAAMAAFGFTYMRLTGKTVGIKHALAIGGSVALVILCFAIFDMNRSVDVQSHLGRLANQIRSVGWIALWDTGVRKINMNIKLMRYTIWSRVFLIMLAALMVSFYRPVGLMEKVRKNYPFIFEGLLGILVGSAVALAVNDSGIVAAATMMIFGMAPLIYLMGRERENDVDAVMAQGD